MGPEHSFCRIHGWKGALRNMFRHLFNLADNRLVKYMRCML